MISCYTVAVPYMLSSMFATSSQDEETFPILTMFLQTMMEQAKIIFHSFLSVLQYYATFSSVVAEENVKTGKQKLRRPIENSHRRWSVILVLQ